MATWSIVPKGSSTIIDGSSFSTAQCIAIDSSHFLLGWRSTSGYGFVVQAVSINTSTWAVTAESSRLVVSSNRYPTGLSFAKIDTNHFLCLWGGSMYEYTSVGYAQTFTVNTSTWAVTTSAAPLSLGALGNSTVLKVDTNHFVGFYMGASSYYYAQTFAVNTTTWAVTTSAASLTFDTHGKTYPIAWNIIDSNHFLVTRRTSKWSYPTAQTFVVNTSTWVVTTSSSALTFDTRNGASAGGGVLIDTSHLVFLNTTYLGYKYQGEARVLDVFSGDYSVSTSGPTFTYSADLYPNSNVQPPVVALDNRRVLNRWKDTFGAGNNYMDILEIDRDTWEVSTKIDTYTHIVANSPMTTTLIDSNYFLASWSGSDSKGHLQVFEIDKPTDVYWVGGTGNWSDATNHWSLTSNGSPTVDALPTEDTNAVFDEYSFPTTGGVVTIDTVWSAGDPPNICKNLDWINVTNAPTLTIPSTANVYLAVVGSALFSANMTVNGGGNLELIGSGTNTIDGRNIPMAIKMMIGRSNWSNYDDASYSLVSNLKVTSLSTDGNCSSFNTGNHTIETNLMELNSDFNLGASSIKIVYTSTLAESGFKILSSGLTTTSAATNLEFLTTGLAEGDTMIFGGQTKTFYDFTITGSGEGAIELNDGATFNKLETVTPLDLTFEQNRYFYFNDFRVNGEEDNLVKIRSSGSGRSLLRRK